MYGIDCCLLTVCLGHFCPKGTIATEQYPCFPGTYTAMTNLSSADECDPCPEGKYCEWGTGL